MLDIPYPPPLSDLHHLHYPSKLGSPKGIPHLSFPKIIGDRIDRHAIDPGLLVSYAFDVFLRKAKQAKAYP
jgi:hypothetical protein